MLSNKEPNLICKQCGSPMEVGQCIDTTGMTAAGEIIHGFVESVVLSTCYKCKECGHSFQLLSPQK